MNGGSNKKMDYRKYVVSLYPRVKQKEMNHIQEMRQVWQDGEKA